jgi:hypothetical protein
MFVFLMVLTPNIWAIEVRSTELIHLRSRNQKILSLSNGNYKYIQYENPIHYFKDGKYIEYDFSLDTLSSNKMSIRSSDFSVTYENTLSEIAAELSFHGQNKLTYLLPNHNTYANLKSKITTNTQTYHALELGPIALSADSTGLNIHQKFYSNRPKTIEYIIQVDKTLTLSYTGSSYKFIDEYGLEFYTFENVLLADSNGLMTHNNQLTITELKDNNYKISVELDNDFINDDNITFPLQMLLSTNYLHNRDYSFIRDKMYVKDTGLQHDSSVFQVAKTKFVFFDPEVEPVSLSEYHHYGLIEIDLRGLISSMDIVDAELILTQTASNTTDSIPLSKVTSHSFDTINGYVNYTKSSIQTKSVVSDLLIYDLLSTLYTAISNEESFLLLELSPLNINLGVSTNKYKTFLSANEGLPDSTRLVIEFESLESIYNTTYGYAGLYEPVYSALWNCLEYVVRQDLEDNFIRDGFNQNIFEQILLDNNGHFDFDLEETFVTAIRQHTMPYAGFTARIINGYDAEIFADEYRIAFRIGNTSSEKTFNLYPSGIWTKNDDFHFMMQHSDGRWSHKTGQYISRLLDYGQNPDMNIWHNYRYNEFSSSYIINFYNGNTYYFAIKPL